MKLIYDIHGSEKTESRSAVTSPVIEVLKNGTKLKPGPVKYGTNMEPQNVKIIETILIRNRHFVILQNSGDISIIVWCIGKPA